MTASGPNTNEPGAATLEFNTLLSIGRYRPFTAGDLLFTQGPDGADAALIRTGIVKMTAAACPRNDELLAIRRAGDLIGEDFAIRETYPCPVGKPAPRKAIALTAGNAIIFSAAQFRRFLEEHPATLLAVAHNLSERLAEAEERIASAARSNADQRLARALCNLHDLGRHGIRGKEFAMPRGSEIPVRLSQGELASWIGASRETIDRTLRRWRDRGIVSTGYRKIAILDLDTLVRIAEQRTSLSANRAARPAAGSPNSAACTREALSEGEPSGDLMQRRASE